MRQALGVSAFSGMLGVTVFGLLFTPVFYVGLRALEERFSRKRTVDVEHEPEQIPGLVLETSPDGTEAEPDIDGRAPFYAQLCGHLNGAC